MQLSGVCAAATVSAQPADRQKEKKEKEKLFFQSDSQPAEQTEPRNIEKKSMFHYVCLLLIWRNAGRLLNMANDVSCKHAAGTVLKPFQRNFRCATS